MSVSRVIVSPDDLQGRVYALPLCPVCIGARATTRDSGNWPAFYSPGNYYPFLNRINKIRQVRTGPPNPGPHSGPLVSVGDIG